MNETPSDDLRFLEREIDRRAVLGGGVSGFLLLAFGALLPSGCRGYPQPPVPLKFFSPEEYAVFQAIARAILGLDAGSVDVAASVDDLVSRM